MNTQPAKSSPLQKSLSQTLKDATANDPEQGVQVALLKDGELAWSAERGKAIMNVHPAKPVTTSTMFNYGSFGKLVLGAFMLREVEKGTFDLDTPIAEYSREKIAGSEVVTIRMLLQHTAGYNNVYAAPETISLFAPGTEGAPIGTAPVNYDPNKPFTFSQLNEGIHAPSSPGENFHYENTNYMILYQLLENEFGGLEQLDSAIAEFIQQSGSVVDADGTQISQDRYSEHTLKNLAHGYQNLSNDGGLKDYNTAYGATGVPTDSMGSPFGDGAFAGTALGAAQFLDALFINGKLLEQKTVEAMSTPTSESLGSGMQYGSSAFMYGMATLIYEHEGKTWRGHPGGFTGSTSAAYSDPSTGLTLVVVTNRSDTEAGADEIWNALASALAQEGFSAGRE